MLQIEGWSFFWAKYMEKYYRYDDDDGDDDDSQDRYDDT